MFDVVSKQKTRKLLAAMAEKIPRQDVIKRDELVPQADGDIRDSGYSWLRSAIMQSRVTRVPREAQMRLVVEKLVRKATLCNLPRILFSDIVFYLSRPKCSSKCRHLIPGILFV